jgi:hypothetical protein
MFDDVQRLRENPRLVDLLTHYATLGVECRDTWQDRLMQMEGVEPRELTRLHGELIAFDWIEQNAGQAVSACYRITVNGLRDLRHIQGAECVVKFPASPEKKVPKVARKKKQVAV